MTTPAWNCFRSPCRISETAIRGNNAPESRVVDSRNCPLFIQPLAFFDEMIEHQVPLLARVGSAATNRLCRLWGTNRPRRSVLLHLADSISSPPQLAGSTRETICDDS